MEKVDALITALATCHYNFFHFCLREAGAGVVEKVLREESRNAFAVHIAEKMKQ